MNRGLAIVISGPSGAGKSTILKKTTARIPGMVFSVSCTTRNPRPGESDNVDYHFISTSQFEEGIRKGDFLEYANVHGNYYGTPKAPMLKVVEECGRYAKTCRGLPWRNWWNMSSSPRRP